MFKTRIKMSLINIIRMFLKVGGPVPPPPPSTDFPTGVPNVVGRYDVTDAGNITVTSGKATQLRDKSGNGRHMTLCYDSTSYPFYTASGGANNKPYLSISSGRELYVSGVNVSQPYTVYLISKQNTFVEGKQVLGLSSSGTGVLIQHVLPSGNALNLYAGNYFPNNTNGYSANWQLLTCVFNNVDSRLQVNNEGYKVGGYNPGQAGNSAMDQIGFAPYYKNADALVSELIIISGIPSASDDLSIRNYLMAKFNLANTPYLCCFGDSITAGALANDWSVDSWAALVAKEKGMHIVNFGSSGTTVMASSGGIPGSNLEDVYTNGFNGDMASGYFTFSYGTNDSGGWASLPSGPSNPAWKSTYKSIVSQFIIRGANPQKIIICTTPYRDGIAGSYIEQANIYSGEIASELGTRFFNAVDYMSTRGGQSLMAPDGLHPTPAGHRVYANGVELQVI